MRNHLLFYASAILLLSACSADKTIEPGNACCTSLSRIDSCAITISEDGYLIFSTSQSLKDYMENFHNGNTKAFYSSNAVTLKGFESVANLGERLECLKTRANDTENISDLEEMTREEYNLMRAENMLFDDALTHIVDTTLRICVEGRLYKITELGTFSVDVNKSEFLEQAIRSFNLEIKRAIKSGGSILLDNNVLFTNSFAGQNIHYSDLQIEETTNAIGAASGNSTINELHKDYNVLSYHWKSNSLLQKFLNSLRGKDVSRGNKFNKNRRVQVYVFDVNYAFYASAGIKVKMQKRKKFLGIPYWKAEKAEKIVIGFNRLDGVMKYKNPRSLSSIIPSPNRKWNSFIANINGIQSKFIYGLYQKLPFIKDWTDNIVVCNRILTI